jgi:hypothetical protein
MVAHSTIGVVGLLGLLGCNLLEGGSDSDDTGTGPDATSSPDGVDASTRGGASADGTGIDGLDTTGSSPETSTGGSESGTTSDDDACVADPVAVEPAVFPVDVLVAVDASGSMNLEMATLAGQFPAFFGALHGLGSVRAALIAPYPDIDPAGVCVGPPMGQDGCPSHDDNPPSYLHHPLALPSFGTLSGIVDSHAVWSSHFRPDAPLHLIVISDDDPATSAQDFLTQLSALDPGDDTATIHGLFARPTAPGCVITSEPGNEYEALVDATGGVAHDICDLDATAFFAEVLTHVEPAAAPPCHYALPHVPEDPQLIAVVVDGIAVPRHDAVDDCNGTGWYYADAQTVALCPAACEPTITVTVEEGCPGPR